MDIKSRHLKRFIEVYDDLDDLEYTLGIAVLREIVFTFDGKVSKFAKDKKIRDLDFSMNVNNYETVKSKGLDVIDSDLVSIKIDGKEQTKIDSENYKYIYMGIRNTLAHNIVESIDYSTSRNSQYSRKNKSVLNVKRQNKSAKNQFTSVSIDSVVKIKENKIDIIKKVAIVINTKEALEGIKFNDNYCKNNQI